MRLAATCHAPGMRPHSHAAPRASCRLEPLKEKLGVLVTNLNPKGLAKAAGVVPGDVLLRVDDTPCTNPDDTAMILRGKSGRFELHLRRGASKSGGSRFGLHTSLHAMVADL